jgi:hypothetical protein
VTLDEAIKLFSELRTELGGDADVQIGWESIEHSVCAVQVYAPGKDARLVIPDGTPAEQEGGDVPDLLKRMTAENEYRRTGHYRPIENAVVVLHDGT